MRRSNFLFHSVTALLTLVCIAFHAHAAEKKSAIRWQEWSPAVWQQSQAENKPIFLYLEAVWCHWCHVMEATTFLEDDVANELNEHYIPVKVDHDARPDLANKYRDYGWPANIVFAPDGRELLKRAGYIAPENFTPLFAAQREKLANLDPLEIEQTPDGELYTALSPALRQRLITRHENSFDAELGGLDLAQKFLDADSVEYALQQGLAGKADELERAKLTLSAAQQLIDPVWGGAYQYSTYGDWQHAHYEKLMLTQGRYLRIYALAYEQLRDPSYLKAMQQIRGYLNNFLRSPEGTYYVSQDADLIQGEKAHDFFALGDKERRALGIPRIDTNVYADANGTAIEGLALMAKATGDKTVLDDALRATAAIRATHQLPSGGFTHSAGQQQGLYLSDNLAMGRAFIALFEATNNPNWLAAAQKVGALIDKEFTYPGGGYASGVDNGTPVKPVPHMDENIFVGRFAAKLYRYSRYPKAKNILAHTLGYLANPENAVSRLTDPGILIIDDEWRELNAAVE